jgi:HK97 family phage portal protein
MKILDSLFKRNIASESVKDLAIIDSGKQIASLQAPDADFSPEEKSASVSAVPLPLAELFASNGWHDLWAYQALTYYRQCAPVFTGVDRIADEVKKIRPVLYNHKKNEFIDDHPVLDFLSHPFADVSYSEFMKEFAVFLIVTGNNYTILRGNVRREPVEMVNAHPTTITLLASPWDGYNDQIMINALPYMDSFYRDTKLIKNQWRFVNDSKLSEIWQTRTNNSRYLGTAGKYGMSILTPIFYEIEQYIHSSIHNKALLTNGAYLSLFFKVDGSLTPDQHTRFKQLLRENFTGSPNAGKIMMGESGMNVTQLGQTNKDMDFNNLKTSTIIQIYNTLKIPLPLVMPEHMTMDNVGKAMLMLYFYAVLPWLEHMFEELSMFLLPRFENTEDLCISYQIDKIPALAAYRMEIAKAKKELGAYSPNELRAMLGDHLISGLDDIYMPANVMPIASAEEQKDYKQFVELLLNQSNSQPLSMAEIKEMSRDYGRK